MTQHEAHVVPAASFARHTFHTFRRTVSGPAGPSHDSWGPTEVRYLSVKWDHPRMCCRFDCSLNERVIKFQKDGRNAADLSCWRSLVALGRRERALCLQPFPFHALGWGEGKNKRWRWKAGGARQPLLSLWEAAKLNVPGGGGGGGVDTLSSLAHSNTLCYCFWMDHWSYGEETKKRKGQTSKPFFNPSPNSLTKTWYQFM